MTMSYIVNNTSSKIVEDPLFGANHFTPIRWMLAGFVALGHFWLVTTGYEPFRIHQWTGGYMAVNWQLGRVKPHSPMAEAME